jgi:hypothetical protein
VPQYEGRTVTDSFHIVKRDRGDKSLAAISGLARKLGKY